MGVCVEEATLKKQFVSKHEKHVCKVCNETFQILIEVLIHAEKELRTDNIENISVKEK